MNGGAVWRATWSLVVTLGIGLGLLEWGPVVALGCLAALTVMAAPSVVLLRSLRASRSAAPEDSWRSGVVRTAVMVASVVVACWAVIRLAPAAALLLATLAVITSPAAVGLVRRAVGRGPTRSARVVVRPAGAAPRVARHVPDAPPPSGPVPERPRPQDLDDRTLCQLWRQSFWELTTQSTPSGYLGVVAWRQCCLDEIERRDSRGLHAWLESGARASGGPEKFLQHPPGGTTDAA